MSQAPEHPGPTRVAYTGRSASFAAEPRLGALPFGANEMGVSCLSTRAEAPSANRPPPSTQGGASPAARAVAVAVNTAAAAHVAPRRIPSSSRAAPEPAKPTSTRRAHQGTKLTG
jgi:hypothetical protein